MPTLGRLHLSLARCSIALGFLVGCGDACDEDACEEISRPQSASIDEGVAGFVAYRTDACENGCCACEAGDATLEVWPTSSRVASIEEATAVVTGGPPAVEIDAHGRYARSLEAGSYLMCQFIGSDGQCAAVEIGPRETATVNVQTRFGPSTIVVFEPGTTTPSNAVFNVSRSPL